MYGEENKIAIEQLQSILCERYELTNALISLQYQLKSNNTYLNVEFKSTFELPSVPRTLVDYKNLGQRLIHIRRDEKKRAEMEPRIIEVLQRNLTLTLVERMQIRNLNIQRQIYKVCYSILKLWKPQLNIQKSNQHDFRDLVHMFKIYFQSEQEPALMHYVQGLLDAFRGFNVANKPDPQISIIIVLLRYLLTQSRIRLHKLLESNSDEVFEKIKQQQVEPPRFRVPPRQRAPATNYSYHIDSSSPAVSNMKSYSSNITKLVEQGGQQQQSIGKLLHKSRYDRTTDLLKQLYKPLLDIDVNHYTITVSGVKDKFENDRTAYCNLIHDF